jgi:hypothetical protein
MTLHGSSHSSAQEAQMFYEQRRSATTWQKWEGPIKTVIPILLSLFLT